MNKKQIGAILIGLGLIVVVGAGIKSTHFIKPGYVGLVYNAFGGIENKTLPQGTQFAKPWESVRQYPVSTTQGNLSKDAKEGSKEDDSFQVPTSDGKQITVDLEYSYHFENDKLPDTYTRFQGKDGETIEQTFIRAKLKTWARDITSTYSVIDIYGDKISDINAKMSQYMTKNFEEYGIVMETTNFTRVELDDKTKEAIQSRINKQQELETSKLENQKAEIDAKTSITKAEADAKVNELKSSSVSDKTLQDKFLEKWDGKMPVVSGGSNTMMDISSLMKK